jgi:cysteine-rich repeat protein
MQHRQEHQHIFYDGYSVTKEHSVRQCMENLMTMPWAAAIIAAGLVGLACSSSGLKSGAHDAEAASGGQPASTISSGITGGSGGTIGPGGGEDANIGGTGGIIGSGGSNGIGGMAGSSGTGGKGGQGPMCGLYPMCNPGDQQVGMDCPSERECYTLSVSCGSGEYNTITCAYGADAGVDAAAFDAGVDVTVDGRTMRSCGNGILEPNQGEKCDDGNTNNGDGCNAICQIEAGWECPTPGQSCIRCGANGCDAGSVGYCGDGILQMNLGEECDLGPLNGMHLDQNGDPTDAGGCPSCTANCMIPLCLL